MESLDTIPELDELHSGNSLIRVPEEQNVPFTARVRALVDTEEFQRLREISQLGLVSAVYPGARHTRFEHALGVYHNALRYLQQLIREPRFCEQVDRKSVELLIASSLLHDLGHWPFCHPIEDLGLKELPPHEAYASRFLAPGTELADVLKSEWEIDAQDVLTILAPGYASKLSSPREGIHSSKYRLLRSILSGPIDIDKMDYLERDSLHCGVPYGRNFDKQRLIQSLILNEAGDGLAITSKGKTAAELMVFARYVMFSEVYWHHAVRSATSMFARAFYELHPLLSLKDLFRFSDAHMISVLREKGAGTPCEPLLEGVFGRKRRLYKQVAEYRHDQSLEIYQRVAGRPYTEIVAICHHLVEEVNRRASVTLKQTDLLLDSPPPHREVEFAIDVYFAKQNQYRPLRSVSPVVDALASTQFDDWVKRVRVFVAPDVRDELKAMNWDEAILSAVDKIS